MFIAIVTIYVIILQLLKIIYLLFKPKFLNVERFGPPSKYMLLVYYLVVTFLLVILTLEKLEILQIEIKQTNNAPLFQIPSDKSLIIVLLIGALAATIHTIIDYYIRKKKKAH
jgi:hypothetical protein